MSDWKLAKEYTEHIDEIEDLQAEVERLRGIILPIGRLMTGNTEGLTEASRAQDKAVEYYREQQAEGQEESNGI